MNYYNEYDKKAAAWLRELIKAGLIPAGDVDERSIVDVQPEDLDGYTQCHFFAGIGGWSLALQLAEWDSTRPVWSGSCPCQPFSSAGKGKGTDDERHLWPEFARLIGECKPPTVFGEQVASKAGREWFDGVSTDLEDMGYAAAAADLCAAGVNAPHIRQRLFWVADAKRGAAERHGHEVAAEEGGLPTASRQQRVRTDAGDGKYDNSRLADAGRKLQTERDKQREAGGEVRSEGGVCGRGGVCGGLGDTNHPRSQGHGRPEQVDGSQGRQATDGCVRATDAWRDFDLVRCVEPTKEPGRYVEKRRRVEPGVEQMADGISCAMELLRNQSHEEIKGILNATQSQKLTDEIMQAMQRGHAPQEVQREIGRCFGVPAAIVLLSILCERARELGIVKHGKAQGSSQACVELLRGLWDSEAVTQVACTSQGWQLPQQLQDELANTLSKVPQKSPCFHELIQSAQCYDPTPLAHGIPGRVGLLRGYGNAIVPQVAAEFIMAYKETA